MGEGRRRRRDYKKGQETCRGDGYVHNLISHDSSMDI